MRLEPAERSTRVWAPPTGLGAACAPHVPTCAAGRGSRDARGAHPGSSASADVNGAAGRLQVWGSSRVPGPLRQRPQFSGFETRVRFWDRCGLHLARPGPPSCSRLRHRRLRVPPPEVRTSVPSRRPSLGHHASLSRRVVCGQRVPESLRPPPARALWPDEIGNLPLRPHFLPNVPHERSRRGVLLIVAPQSWQHCLPRAPAPVTGGAGRGPRVQWAPRAGTGLTALSLLRHSAYRLLLRWGRTRRPGERPSSAETGTGRLARPAAHSPALPLVPQALEEYLGHRSCHQARGSLSTLPPALCPVGAVRVGRPPCAPMPAGSASASPVEPVPSAAGGRGCSTSPCAGHDSPPPPAPGQPRTGERGTLRFPRALSARCAPGTVLGAGARPQAQPALPLRPRRPVEETDRGAR